jgi:hypothetical protein
MSNNNNAVERIQRYLDDQTKILVPGMKPAKITSEIANLKKWLVKHQDEAVPDGSKGKIMTVLEKYNRAAGYMADLRGPVANLFQDYLALPEGKLLSSKNKDKVKVWLANLGDGEDGDDSKDGDDGNSKAAVVKMKTRRWDGKLYIACLIYVP